MQISIADNWILLASLHCTQSKSEGKNLSYRDLLQLKQANLYRASSLSWCGSSCCKRNRCLIWLRRKKHNKSPQSCCLCSQRRSAGPNIWYHVLYEDRNTEEGIKLLSSFQACSLLLGAAHSFLPAPRERQLQRAASAARASCCVLGLVQPTWTNLPWHRRHAWAAHLSLLRAWAGSILWRPPQQHSWKPPRGVSPSPPAGDVHNKKAWGGWSQPEKYARTAHWLTYQFQLWRIRRKFLSQTVLPILFHHTLLTVRPLIHCQDPKPTGHQIGNHHHSRNLQTLAQVTSPMASTKRNQNCLPQCHFDTESPTTWKPRKILLLLSRRLQATQVTLH